MSRSNFGALLAFLAGSLFAPVAAHADTTSRSLWIADVQVDGAAPASITLVDMDRATMHTLEVRQLEGKEVEAEASLLIQSRRARIAEGIALKRADGVDQISQALLDRLFAGHTDQMLRLSAHDDSIAAAVPTLSATIAPTSYNFGNVAFGSSASMSSTITNTTPQR